MTQAPRSPHRSRAVLVLLAALTLLVAACGDDGGDGGDGNGDGPKPSSTQTGPGDTSTDGGPTTGSEPAASPRIEAVSAAEADQPIMLLPRPGDDGHLYLAERPGRIRRVAVEQDGRKLTAVGDVLLDITEDTSMESERGLLGLAFSEDGNTIYVSYTNTDGDTRVDSYAMTGDAIDASTKRTILEQDQPYPNHNGGNILLGPDGKLWFGFGDGGSGDDPENNAQDPDTLLGKIIRFDPGEDPEIVVSGLRNPWRFSFDTDGSLWIGDVGQDEYEEIDRLDADEIEGANLGWSGFEGTHEHVDGEERRGEDPIPPVFEFSHSDGGNCSVTGGFVYRGKEMPALEGAYLFADYCAGNLRAIRVDDQGKFTRELDLDLHLDSPISFGADQAGEPYVLSQGGTIYRLVPMG